jgi:hypothetical protein
MPYIREKSGKIAAIRGSFRSLVGKSLTGYQCAEIFLDETGTWDRWDDLPVRLFFGRSDIVSVAWTKFDDLLVTPDDSIPDWYSESTHIRWVDDQIPQLNECVGKVLRNVRIGRGEMGIGGVDIEVWNRLMLDLDGVWFEIFNALDENGYAHHIQSPDGEFHSCL